MIGSKLQASNTSEWLIWLFLGHFIFYILLSLILEILDRLRKKYGKKNNIKIYFITLIQKNNRKKKH